MDKQRCANCGHDAHIEDTCPMLGCCNCSPRCVCGHRDNEHAAHMIMETGKLYRGCPYCDCKEFTEPKETA